VACVLASVPTPSWYSDIWFPPRSATTTYAGLPIPFATGAPGADPLVIVCFRIIYSTTYVCTVYSLQPGSLLTMLWAVYLDGTMEVRVAASGYLQVSWPDDCSCRYHVPELIHFVYRAGTGPLLRYVGNDA
jgi:hypothetical protein